MRDQYTFSGQCQGTTKAGKPCGQRSIYANGYHGGDSTEYMKERIQRLIEKSRRRTRKLMRKLGLDTKER